MLKNTGSTQATNDRPTRTFVQNNNVTEQQPLKPRGSTVALPNGGLPEMISPYMQKLIASTGGVDGPIGRQFVARPDLEQKTEYTDYDIQEEHKYEVAPGVVYKYKGAIDTNGTVTQYGRVLWTISRFCATYCRFCFRGRVVGVPTGVNAGTGETIAQKPYLQEQDITEVITFIRDHKEINEVILSGGDPLIAPQHYLETIFGQLVELQQSGNLDFIRVHTRAPVTNPFVIKDWHFELFKQCKVPYIVLHINHPAELTPEVLDVIERLRTESHAELLSQSVLLKGVNDSIETLQTLFIELAKVGVRPYYLHHIDPVYWARSFMVDFDTAVELWQNLRPRLSGIAASAKFVIDTPYGVGKIAVPESKWHSDGKTYKDFEGIEQRVE